MPRHSNSDHRAIIAEVYSDRPKKLKAYRRGRQRFPMRIPKVGPRNKMEAAFEELQSNCIKPPPRQAKSNAWISEETWQIIDHRATLRRMGRLSRANTRRLGRKVKASLQKDRQKRAATAASAIEGHLDSGELQEAWRCLKGWYATASDKAPKPCYESMVKQTKKRAELYRKVPPWGILLYHSQHHFLFVGEINKNAATKNVCSGSGGGSR